MTATIWIILFCGFSDLLHILSYLPKDLNFVNHTSYIGWKEYALHYFSYFICFYNRLTLIVWSLEFNFVLLQVSKVETNSCWSWTLSITKTCNILCFTEARAARCLSFVHRYISKRLSTAIFFIFLLWKQQWISYSNSLNYFYIYFNKCVCMLNNWKWYPSLSPLMPNICLHYLKHVWDCLLILWICLLIYSLEIVETFSGLKWAYLVFLFISLGTLLSFNN